MIPSMSRRNWIGLSSAALFGCQERKVPAATAPNPAPASRQLQAGPFSVTVPDAWAKTAVIRKVPIHPLYTAEEWKLTKSDKHFLLKPSYYNRPLHWTIRLPAATPEGIKIDLENADDDPTAAQILIHKSDEWGSILTDGIEGREKSAELLSTLRKEMDGAAAGDGNVDSPAFIDGGLGFTSLKKQLEFDGGHGIRMINQWLSEHDLMRKGRLHYLFVGMSDDNTCQIIATFPITLPGLPDDSPDAEHLGRSVRRWDELSRNFDIYCTEAEAWLTKHAAEITPNLDTLDEMLKSLVVRRWE